MPTAVFDGRCVWFASVAPRRSPLGLLIPVHGRTKRTEIRDRRSVSWVIATTARTPGDRSLGSPAHDQAPPFPQRAHPPGRGTPPRARSHVGKPPNVAPQHSASTSWPATGGTEWYQPVAPCGAARPYAAEPSPFGRKVEPHAHQRDHLALQLTCHQNPRDESQWLPTTGSPVARGRVERVARSPQQTIQQSEVGQPTRSRRHRVRPRGHVLPAAGHPVTRRSWNQPEPCIAWCQPSADTDSEAAMWRRMSDRASSRSSGGTSEISFAIHCLKMLRRSSGLIPISSSAVQTDPSICPGYAGPMQDGAGRDPLCSRRNPGQHPSHRPAQ